MSKILSRNPRKLAKALLLFLVGASLQIQFPLLGMAENPTKPSTTSSSVEVRLINKARELKLSQALTWRALLHCERNTGTECSSAITESKWFLSSGSDPELELVETIKRFIYSQDEIAAGLRCRFPARYEWLRENLGEDFPEVPMCKELSEWLSGINPHSLSLIFPSSFLNNPASAFGHTLLRINPRPGPIEAPLLAYSINFAADTKGDSALPFVYRGVFGGYAGYFSVAPFYEQVTKYSEMENRDIWEYALNLSDAEVRRAVLHIYELIDTPFPYYYFDNNCSYYLLSIIEVARPSIDLQGVFPLWVIPIDTIRVLNSRRLITTHPIFRPSIASRVKYLAAQTNVKLRRLAKTLASPKAAIPKDELDVLATKQQKHSLELADQFLTYSQLKSVHKDNDLRTRAWQLLKLRSALGRGAVYDISPPGAPETGHKTVRVSLGAGVSQKRFTELAFRPSFHEQIDPPSGYLMGSQMSFLDTVVRQTEGSGSSLRRLTVFDIESLSSQDDFFNDLSWSLRLGYDQEAIDSTRTSEIVSQSAGFGSTRAIGRSTILFFLLSGELQVGSELKGDIAFGIGPRMGLISHLSNAWSVEANLLHEQFVLGDQHMRLQGEFANRISLSRDVSLRLWFNSNRNLGKSVESGGLNFDYFFSPMESLS